VPSKCTVIIEVGIGGDLGAGISALSASACGRGGAGDLDVLDRKSPAGCLLLLSPAPAPLLSCSMWPWGEVAERETHLIGAAGGVELGEQRVVELEFVDQLQGPCRPSRRPRSRWFLRESPVTSEWVKSTIAALEPRLSTNVVGRGPCPSPAPPPPHRRRSNRSFCSPRLNESSLEASRRSPHARNSAGVPRPVRPLVRGVLPWTSSANRFAARPMTRFFHEVPAGTTAAARSRLCRPARCGRG